MFWPEMSNVEGAVRALTAHLCGVRTPSRAPPLAHSSIAPGPPFGTGMRDLLYPSICTAALAGAPVAAGLRSSRRGLCGFTLEPSRAAARLENFQ